MPLILPANTLSAAGYDVANSCRFNDDDSAYMYKSLGTPTSQRKFTFSCWFKPAVAASNNCTLISWGAGSDNEFASVVIQEGTCYYLQWYLNDTAGSSNGSGDKRTTMLFRDPSAWYNLVCALDTEQDDGADRQKFYVNGVRITSFTEETWIAEDYDVPALASGKTVEIGRRVTSGSYHMDGYMAEVCFVDGLQLAPTSFGEFNSDSPTIWQPIDVSGLTFGNNGFYLDFEASSNLGNDVNGGTDLTESGLAAADQATDTPTNNFCTGNPIIHGGKLPTISEGNCLFVSGGDWMHIPSTIGVANGKWYAEFKCVAKTGGQMMGVVDAGSIAGWGASPPLYVGNDALGHCYQDNGNKQTGDTATSYGATYTDGDIIGAALNADDGEITFYKNNAVQASGTAITLPTSTSSDGIWFWLPSVETGTIAANWGGCSAFAISSAANDENGYGVFEYAPPSDYLAMCTKNLATNG